MYDDVDTAELREDYRKHLEEAMAEFNSWPSWKQSVLEKAVSASEEGAVKGVIRECSNNGVTHDP
jgi:hypothetical protein